MRQSILITGASGKTGKAVIAKLSSEGHKVFAFTHKNEYVKELSALGAIDVRVGDLRSDSDLEKSLSEVDGIYHICPNMTADEFTIGKNIIRLCMKHSVNRFVYHSVIHPHASQMAHHWQKMQVEEELFKSKLDYTILQPTAYFQNIMGYVKMILEGVYPMPYSTSARISMVDLRDVAAAVVKVFESPATIHGIYEIVGTLPMSQVEIAEQLALALKRPVEAVEIDKTEWEENAHRSNMPEYSRKTLLAMFDYYDKYGLEGSPLLLTYILGRNPITMEQFLHDEFGKLIST
jgi:uncharacterized protein YbjT (DUF2867 family)